MKPENGTRRRYPATRSRYPAGEPPETGTGEAFSRKAGGGPRLNILIDNSLTRFKKLYAAAGHPNCVFKTNFEDLQKITEGSVKDITQ